MNLILFLIWAGILFSSAAAFSEYKCYGNIEKEVKGLKVRKSLGGIVGIGWNDITNEETLPILSITYNNCRIVSDGDFLIPDNVIALPIKTSHIVESAESFETFSKFKNSIGGSIEGHAGGTFSKIGVSGSLSVETKIGKEHMEQNSRTGFSNKLEYYAYKLIANENYGFDKTFTDRLKEVAEAIKSGNSLLAQYEAESIIGDYGTHVTNKAVVGAKVLILGFSTFANQSQKNSFSLKMKAKFDAKFLVGNAGGKVEGETENSNEDGSKSSASHTYIFTHGGADIKNLLNNPGNKMSVDSVVGLKRSGIEIHSLIHKGILEGIYDPQIIEIVQDLLYNATRDFYLHNTIPGCTSSSKQNYFLKANVEDGTCKEVSCGRKVTVINIPPSGPRRFINVRPVGPSRVINVRPKRSLPFFPIIEDAVRNIVEGPRRIENVVRDIVEGPRRIDNFVRDIVEGPRRIDRGRYGDMGRQETKEQYIPCHAPIIGGVMQECEYISSSSKAQSNLTYGNQCDEYSNQNQLTKSYSCPSGFEKKIAGSFYATFKHRAHTVKIEKCNSTNCHSFTKTHTITDKIKVTAYWCSFIVPVTDPPASRNFSSQFQNMGNVLHAPHNFINIRSSGHFVGLSKLHYTGEGMVFGGIFENDNIFSDNERCEAGFQEYPFLHNLKICLASPTDLTAEKSVVFGGMISCRDVIQECPNGLSKYLATIINGCPYYYCASIAKRTSVTNLHTLKKTTI
uniref:Macrophage-expressed gene 1 protein n=1 Tax=Panagrolaimus sp. ES5 TaxID=591445 RepID=A0AC34FKG2_9BILA